MTTLETLKADVIQAKTAYEAAQDALRDYQIANSDFALGDKVEYGYPHRRKVGLVVGFRANYDQQQIPIVAPLKKDGTPHAVTRDRWPENPVKLEAL